MKPIVSCLLVAGSAVVAITWVILLLSSLFFRPKPIAPRISATVPRRAGLSPPPEAGSLPMRPLERMLVVTSALLILAALAIYLAVRSMPH